MKNIGICGKFQRTEKQLEIVRFRCKRIFSLASSRRSRGYIRSYAEGRDSGLKGKLTSPLVNSPRPGQIDPYLNRSKRSNRLNYQSLVRQTRFHGAVNSLVTADGEPELQKFHPGARDREFNARHSVINKNFNVRKVSQGNVSSPSRHESLIDETNTTTSKEINSIPI